jgi:hypothetical protein
MSAKEGQKDRKVLREYFETMAKKYGYTVSKWRAGLTLYIHLNTRPMGTCVSDDAIKLALRKNALYYAHNDGVTCVASLADPECAEKTLRFVKDVHLAVLTARRQQYSHHIGSIDEEIERLESIE